MGRGWSIKAGKNKIVIWSLAKTPIPEVLFTYTGLFSVKNIKFVTWDKQLNYAIGYKGKNKKYIINKGNKVKFTAEPNFKKFQINVSSN